MFHNCITSEIEIDYSISEFVCMIAKLIIFIKHVIDCVSVAQW